MMQEEDFMSVKRTATFCGIIVYNCRYVLRLDSSLKKK